MAHVFSRRSFLKLTGLTAVAALGVSSYAVAIEPRFRLVVTPYRLRPPGFPALERPIRIAALADLHACDPWMAAPRIAEIVEATNALEPDIVVLLGDYVSGISRFGTEELPMAEWAAALSDLAAPFGTFAVLGNHDWWLDGNAVRRAMEKRHIPVMENDAESLEVRGTPFWLAGLGDQLAHYVGNRTFRGTDDLPGTIDRLKGDQPAILLAHEPDVFPTVPGRVALTLSGHTHGGQVNLPFIGAAFVPSQYGRRYAYGHVVEDDRHLIVSGGLGCSNLPVRFGVPPEIVLVELG